MRTLCLVDGEHYLPVTKDALARLAQKAKLEVVSLIGKTVLPLRKHPDLLKDVKAYKALLRVEKKLARDSANLGTAAHLQIILRKPA